MNKNNSTTNSNTSTGNQNTSANNQQQIMIVNEGYYYKQLDTYSKIIYDTLKADKEEIKSGTHKIEFGKQFDTLLDQENGAELLQEYYQAAMETYLYDNPDVFYLDVTKMYLNIQTTKKLFTTTYEVYIDSGENKNYLAKGYNSKEQIERYENEIEEEAQKIIQKTTGKNDFEKIQIIHDYLIDNISYDQSLSKDNIYNMYGALVKKECVCEGYAKAFKYLLNQVEIEAVIVIGDATDSDGNTQGHAWNYVKFNNKWYAVDVTWDDPILIGGGFLTNRNRYKYFLKGSNTMSRDHVESHTFVENGKEYKYPTLSINDY